MTLAEVLLNLAFSGVAFAAAAGVVRPAVRTAIRWAAGERFGLIHLVALPGLQLLAMPFRKQRDYWRGADGPVERDPVQRGPDPVRLEE